MVQLAGSGLRSRQNVRPARGPRMNVGADPETTTGRDREAGEPSGTQGVTRRKRWGTYWWVCEGDTGLHAAVLGVWRA